MIKLEFKTRGKIITRYEVFSTQTVTGIENHQSLVTQVFWNLAKSKYNKVSMVRRYVPILYLPCKWQGFGFETIAGNLRVQLELTEQGQIYHVNSVEHIFILYVHTWQNLSL